MHLAWEDVPVQGVQGGYAGELHGDVGDVHEGHTATCLTFFTHGFFYVSHRVTPRWFITLVALRYDSRFKPVKSAAHQSDQRNSGGTGLA